MENKTLTSAFLISRFTQQANNKVYGTNTMYGQYFISGFNGWYQRTKDNSLILSHDCLAYSRMSTPWGYLVIYNGVYSKDMTPADEEVKDKCGLLQIIPEHRTERGHYGPQFLVTKFKHQDSEYQAQQSVVDKVKGSKFHTMNKIDCRDPDNEQTCKDMFEFENSFYCDRNTVTKSDYDNSNTMWTQHLKHWFDRKFINDTAGLGDEVRKWSFNIGDRDYVGEVFRAIFSNNLETNINFDTNK